MHSISLIVATKDRPRDLERLLESLRRQDTRPAEIVIVDAGSESAAPVVTSFPELTIRYLKHWPPSASAQRNVGIMACSRVSTLIGFADDDTTFEPNAFSCMIHYWNAAPPDVLGAAFNIRNYPHRHHALLKHSRLAERLGFYSPAAGSVSLSGWQTVIRGVHETQYVGWLPSTASIFRREIFATAKFDEFFENYSYLEDLDFSYTVGREGRLVVVADACYSHFPSLLGRISDRRFGRYEVRNRLYFVRKHKLSITRCYVGVAIRLAMSLVKGLSSMNAVFLNRAIGNLLEVCRSGGPLTNTKKKEVDA